MSAELRRVLVAAVGAAFNAVFIAGVGAWTFGDAQTAVGLPARLAVAACALAVFALTLAGQWWLLGRPAVTECRERATTGDKVVSGFCAMAAPAGILSVQLIVAFGWLSAALFVLLSVVTFLFGYHRFDKEPWSTRWFRR